MSPASAALLHIAIGSVALVAYWLALLSTKGALTHRRAGRICLLTLVLVGFSVGPILLTRPGPFDPGWIVQMVYLTLCLTTVSAIAFAAIRLKSSPERFRSTGFRLMGPVLLALGLIVLSAGIIKADPVAITLSWVGLAFGPAMIAFSRFRGTLHPRWWLGWHLNAVCALFNAVNGTFLFVAARWFEIAKESAMQQAGFQLLTIAIALVLRIKLGATFNAPLGFGRDSALGAAPASP